MGSRDQWRWDDSAISGQIGAPSLEAATEETTIALPASEDVNTTAGDAPSSSSLQGLLSETIYCNPYLQQMCPPGNVAYPNCGSDRCECPSGPGPSLIPAHAELERFRAMKVQISNGKCSLMV